MIVTVTPNPALDLTWEVPRLDNGTTHRVAPSPARAGGKGVNVARLAHSLGRATLALAPVGGATGDVFAADLRRAGIPHRLVPGIHPTRWTAAIVDRSTGEATLLTEQAPADHDVLHALDEAFASALPAARVAVVSGSMPEGAPGGYLSDLVRRARGRSVPVIVDTSGAHLLAAARAGATVLKPNIDEARAATGEHDADAAAAALLSAGAGTVYLSCGADGLVRYDEAGAVRGRLPAPVTGNATGAGDAAVTAIAIGIAEDWDAERILRTAVSWSASAVLAPRAGEITAAWHEIHARVRLTGDGA